MTFIDDDGNEIETSGEIAITKQAVSFFNSKIKGDVSTTFSIDNNSKNWKTLGYYGPQMLNQIAYTKQPFSRVRNGNILDRGFIVIQSDKGSTLSCFYVSGNSNWFQLLQGLITELDFKGIVSAKDYVVKWDGAGINSTFNNNFGITFPLVDWVYNLKKGGARYGGGPVGVTGLNTSTVVDLSANYTEKALFELYPCFYVSTLISELCSQNQIKISGNLLEDPLYKSLVIPPVSGLMKKNTGGKLVQAFGSSQVFGGSAKYTSFTESFDSDNYFSNNTFTSKNKTLLRFELTLVTTSVVSPTTPGAIIYKNFSTPLITISFSQYTNQKLFAYVDAVPGDIYEVYASNAGSYTFNLAVYENDNLIPGDYINPYMFLPPMSGINLLKNIFNMFGCVVTFDEYSKSITADIIEKINTEDAYDWSDYFISAEFDYTLDQGKNNYLRFNKPDDDNFIKKYNDANFANFGDGNIQTPNTLKENKDLFVSSFSPSSFGQGINNFYLTNVNLIDLTDQEPISFTAAAAVGGIPEFTDFTLSVATVFKSGEVIRISTNNTNLGYFTVQLDSSGTTLRAIFEFPGTTFTGLIYKQEMAYKDVAPRLLSVKNSTNISDISPSSSIHISEIGTVTSMPYAIFTKQFTSEPIDGWRNNLAFDNPDIDGYNDPTLKELYFNKISRFLQNPNIECEMILPEAEFQRFKFDRFIYLNTEGLRGYFFVESIENYIDGTTPVTVNLYML